MKTKNAIKRVNEETRKKNFEPKSIELKYMSHIIIWYTLYEYYYQIK